MTRTVSSAEEELLSDQEIENILAAENATPHL
jgi:hypothetical protein